MRNYLKLALASAALCCLCWLSGCGGGGGGTTVVNPPATASKAVITLGTRLPAGSGEQLGSIDLNFQLPAGVTLATGTGEIPTSTGGPLQLTGVGSSFAALPGASASLIGNYQPASGAQNGTVHLIFNTLLNNQSGVQGMAAGDFAVLTCTLTPGVTIDLSSLPSVSVLIANVAGTKLYDTLGNLAGPASATYTAVVLDQNGQVMSTSSGSF